MSNNELAIILPEEWQVLTQQANALVASGFLPQSVNTVQKALAIITLGRELGIGAWAALNGVNVIQGKPTVSPQLMLAMINAKGQLEDMRIEASDEGCTVTMKRKGRTPHAETFDLKDAAAMGLTSKDNYRKQPATMMKWRAVAACARVVFPDVIMNLYTPEELGADVITDEAGNMQIIEVKRETPTEPLRLIEPSASPEQPSAGVRGAGIVQPPKFKDPTPEELERSAAFVEEVLEADLVDAHLPSGDPNVYHATALVVNRTKTATQYILKAGSSNILLSNLAVLDGLFVGDVPVTALNVGTYPLLPSWIVTADKLANGAWEVLSVATEIPVS